MIIVFLFFIISLVAAFLIIKYLKFPEITDTLILFEDTSRSKGCGIAYLIEKKIVKGGRLKLTYLPRDLKVSKPQTIIVDQMKTDSRPKGMWMQEHAVIRILPEDSVVYHSNILKEIEHRSAESNIIKAQKEGLIRQSSHLKELGEGEISNMNIQLMNEFNKNLVKNASKDEKTTFKPGSYPQDSQNRDSY
jgi:hypothetical protein